MGIASDLLSNPFPGLRPFNDTETHLFFGRDGQSDELAERLSRHRFLAVVGTSGSGKSSLVRAGLLSALHGGFMPRVGANWRVASFRPRSNPIGNLAIALNDGDVYGSEEPEKATLQSRITEAILRRSSLGLIEVVRQASRPENENLLVVVDQFEELFRFQRIAGVRGNEEDAAAFIRLLLEAAGQQEIPIYLVITMRSDYLGDCAQFSNLPEAINNGQYLIPRLTREQRREAILGPIGVVGGDIAPSLVNEVLNDVGDDPDQLPALEHALMRTWNEWFKDYQRDPEKHAQMGPDHYRQIGRMAGALEQHAEEAYQELRDARSQKIAEKLFKALTEKEADNREIRRPANLSEICAIAAAKPEDVIKVINVFRREGRTFLMPAVDPEIGEERDLTADSEIDISHESLIRGWRRLKRWVDEEGQSARDYLRLVQTEELYRKSEASRLSGRELRRAKEWLAKSQPNLAWAQRYHPNFEGVMQFVEQSRRVQGIKGLLLLLAGLLVISALGYGVSGRIRVIKTETENEQLKILTSKLKQKETEIVAQNMELEQKNKEIVKERDAAEQQRKLAEQQRVIAEEAATEAQKQRALAEERKQEVDTAKQEVVRQSEIAKREKARADSLTKARVPR